MKFILFPCFLTILVSGKAVAVRVPAGIYENANVAVAGGNSAADLTLTGDATFGWQSDGLSGTIDLGGHTLIWDTGGGNERTCNATIRGTGDLIWVGGGSSLATQLAPGWLGGASANTFSGTLRLRQGTLVLNKPANVAAYGGKQLIIGEGSANQSILRWGNSHQLPDDAALVLTGNHPVILKTSGFSEVCGPLSVHTDAEIDLSGGPAEVRFGDSRASAWVSGKQLVVRGWNGNALGGTAKRVLFGKSAEGLTATQLAAVGFVNPDGFPKGIYRSAIRPDGEVVPSGGALTPVNAPFQVDEASDQARRASYEINGLKALAGVSADPAMPKRIGFFGDSITWLANGAGDPSVTANRQNNFQGGKQHYNQIGNAIGRNGGKNTKLLNFSINGGGVQELEDGMEHVGNDKGKILQPAFAEIVNKEALDLAVIQIGVNDAGWRETSPDVFASSLAKMVQQAQAQKCKVVIVSPLCLGELPDGTNPKDPIVEKIVEASRKVAADSKSTFVDLRAAFLGWSRNHNRELKLDGTLISQKEGLLTSDGVHPNDFGYTLLANLVADGMVRATGITPAVKSNKTNPFNLVPLPKSVEVSEGLMPLTASSRIVVNDASLAPLAEILASEFQLLTGLSLSAASPPAKAGDIVLHLDPTMKGEANQLVVSNIAGVRAGNYQAIASATSTLVQLVQTKAGSHSIPQVKINDDASYGYRAILLDLGRKYHTISSIEQTIKLCRLYKIRYIQLHLSDDQLFMFPSQKFSKAGGSNREFARFEPPSAPKIKPYTREEIIALDQFAARNGVGLIPEIDLPGHSGRLIADEAQTFALAGNGSTVNIANPKTLEGVEILLNEVMDVFRSSPFVHLGADEVSLAGLEESSDYQAALAKDPALKSPHDVYSKFISFMHSVVAKRGRKSIAWEEAWTTSGPYPLPKDVVVMVWSQARNPGEITKSGYDIINTTWTPLYLVRDNKKSPRFLFDWNPTLFGREGSEDYTWLEDSSKLLGCQLSSWENSEAIEIQSMRDRAAIVAERCWNSDADGSYEEFQNRWKSTDAILERLIHPVELKTEGTFTRDEHTFSGSLTVTLSSRRGEGPIRYTLDNSVPGPHWQTYDAPLQIDKPVFLRAGLFDRAGKPIGGLVGAWFRPE
jgi:hexosaminidase